MMAKKETIHLNLSQAAALLRMREHYIVLCHANPDVDAIGSAVGLCRILRRLGKGAQFLCPDPIPAQYTFLTEQQEVLTLQTVSASDLREKTIVTVDTAELSLSGQLCDMLAAYPPLLSLDHHAACKPFSQYLYLDARAAACAEIIAALAQELGVGMTAAIALPLYAGINADTGGFRYSNTTSQTHLRAAELLSQGIDGTAVNRHLYEDRSLSEIAALRLALTQMRLCFDGRVAVVSFSAAMLQENGLKDTDLDSVVNLLRSIHGVGIAAVLKPRGEELYKVSMRSKGQYTVNEICAALGGGGHACAAGCTVSAKTSQAAEQLVLGQIAKAL